MYIIPGLLGKQIERTFSRNYNSLEVDFIVRRRDSAPPTRNPRQKATYSHTEEDTENWCRMCECGSPTLFSGRKCKRTSCNSLHVISAQTHP